MNALYLFNDRRFINLVDQKKKEFLLLVSRSSSGFMIDVSRSEPTKNIAMPEYPECLQCRKPILGDAIGAEERWLHAECFRSLSVSFDQSNLNKQREEN